MKKKLFFVATIAIILLVLSVINCLGVFDASVPDPEKSPVSSTDAASSEAEETVSSAISSKEESSAVSSEAEPEVNLPDKISTNGTVDADGLVFTVHSVTVSKTLGELPLPISRRENTCWMESDGTLIDDHSYFCIEMTVENVSYSQDFYSSNSAKIFFCDDAGPKTNYGNEIVTASIVNVGDQSYFEIDLTTGTSADLTIAFIVEDEEILNAKHFVFFPNANSVDVANKVPASDMYQWVGGMESILLNDFVGDVEIQPVDFVPAAAEKPVPTALGETTQNYFVGSTVMDVTVSDTAPTDDVKLIGELPTGDVSFVAVCTQYEPMDYQGVKGGSSFVRVGNDHLYVYDGDNRVAEIGAYAVQVVGEKIKAGMKFEMKQATDVIHIFAVPSEYLDGQAELLYGVQFELLEGYKAELYDPDSRTLYWHPEIYFVEITEEVNE